MEVKRCSRCGNFYIAEGDVCPKCSTKDMAEFDTFKNYVQENGFSNDAQYISSITGIAEKNINRFLENPEINKNNNL